MDCLISFFFDWVCISLSLYFIYASSNRDMSKHDIETAVWQYVEIKSSQNFCKNKANRAVFVNKWRFQIAQKAPKYFGLLLQEHLLLKTFKNCPIWSLWLEACIFLHTRCLLPVQYGYLFLVLSNTYISQLIIKYRNYAKISRYATHPPTTKVSQMKF